MIEVFAGGAVLTSVAKHFGLGGIAVDKKRKSNARCTIFQLDLMEAKDRELLEEWLNSPLLLWVHFAPVCGTASRAREIPRPDIPFAPRPLRSLEFPLGLPSLSGDERRRVGIANELFHYTCFLFALCIVRGVLATMENPRGSYLWVTEYVLALMRIYPLYATDFQACMYGSMRDKWTRIVASFPEIVQMDATCNRQHPDLGWGFTVNQSGEKVWATAEESKYPRKLCVALVQIFLRIASQRGVILKPESLHDISNHPLLTAKQSQLATGVQPKGAKIPPLVPDFQQTAVFVATGPADIPCPLLGKLPHDITLRTESLQLAILASCKSSGDVAVDKQLLEETRDEVRRGWACGPIQSLPEGAVVSRRFLLVQGPKTRMIVDYTISGINDTAACNNKVDLHMVDTFASVIREFFFACEGAGMKSEILAKTYDLKSAYRQVPVREDHLKFFLFLHLQL
eukprot:s116_g28.t1